MKTIKYIISTGFVGAQHEGVFEVPDDTDEEEINEIIREEVWEYIHYSWEIVPENEE